ncbi:Ig-like domain-containing protein, partial [Leyella stercorea]|uniref:Ig-like domain-containing protein n=1 Tax=Leyella stercorea TaxID=363265 RepID=UPI003A8E6BFE
TNTTKRTIIPTENYKYVGFYSAKANYIKKITIVWEKAATTPATTTTFGTDSRKTFTFTNGTLEGFTTPKATATKSDDNTNLSDLIEYASSDADIVAVDSKTGELTFTNTKFGEATITATLPKTDTYQTSTDSYVVENKDNHIATSLSFNGTDITLTEGKTDAGADFTGYTATEASNIAGTITYAASGDAVATVNPTTGAVTINATTYGTTTITATFTPADPTQYSGSTATYQITNKKAVDLSEITFNVSEDKSNNSSQQTEDNLNKSIVKIYSTKAILGNGTDYRFYKNSKTTFSLTDPTRVITSIKFIHSNTTDPNFTTDKNTYDKASGTWTGYEESVTFTNPGSVIKNVTQIIVTTAEKKAAPALSFAEATVTKELVAGTIDLQTITKPEDLDASAITYASSDDTTAKVEGNTTIRLYKTGEVTITATSAATDKYAAGTASYKLVIEDNRATDTNFKFAAESYNADLAEATAGIVTFNAADVLQNPHSLNVTYTISPESANATIGGTDGKALIEVSGIYTITATAAANDTYKETTATCTLKVTNSAVEEVSIEFVAGVDKGNNSSTTADDTVEKGCVLISSKSAALGRDDNYRFYGSTHTISTKIGKITKIEFVGNNIIDNKTSNPLTNLTSADNNYTRTDPNNGVWVGSAKEVVFTNSKQARATNIIVTVEVPKAKSYTLDETKTDNVIETYENANVTLQRILSKDYWNTFCVPFALDAKQVTQYFGEGTQLRTYEGNCENNIVYFATVDNIEAGKPYIMKPGNAVVTNPTFEGVSMVATGLDENGNPQAVGATTTVQMKGIYNQVLLRTDKTELFLGDNDLFYYPINNTESRTIGGLRAYFIVPQGTDIKKLRANLDGTPTSLDTIFDTEESNAPVYNLQGQYVGNSLRALKSGIYIQNGKKVAVK